MILFGIDILLQQNPLWKNLPIALVTNHAATTNQLQPSRKALLDAGFNIVQLFSPEHGLDVLGEDGAIINDGVDALTGLPIISLYNEKLQPTAIDLKHVEIVLFDIPDIGCRCYTYLWTMTHVLQSCATHQKKLIILDRPNPVSGNLKLAEGPMLDEEKCSSFIGRWKMPMRHCCTMGELALYFNSKKNINASIEVIKCANWNRNMFQTEWGIALVPTSPAIKNFEAMLLYAGIVLLEATNISEGRGTSLSFNIAGTPWLNASALMKQLNNENVFAKEIQFTPTESKYPNELCNGIQFTVTKTANFNSVKNGLLFIKLVKDLHKDFFKWKAYPTNVNPSGNNHLDKLLGIENSEDLFNLPMNVFIINVNELTSTHHWKTEIENYLLY